MQPNGWQSVLARLEWQTREPGLTVQAPPPHADFPRAVPVRSQAEARHRRRTPFLPP